MDLRVNICGVELKNPITTASGTFGFGHEYGEFFDLSELGGIGVKGLTPTERLGNPAPRIAETPSGWRFALWSIFCSGTKNEKPPTRGER